MIELVEVSSIGFGQINQALASQNRTSNNEAKFKDETHTDEEVNNSPRSRLDDISKSYNAPSTILRPKTVDFEASVMKLSDNDERLKVQIELALKAQKEVFEKKIETYKAVQRNFGILKAISLKQQEDFHAAMRHSNEMQRRQDSLIRENASMKEMYNRMSTDLDRLKKKELEFDQVLSNRLEQQNEVDVLKTNLNKLTIKNETLVQNNTVLEAEMTVIKREILKEKLLQEEM